MVVADFSNAPIDIMSTERGVHAIRSFVKNSIVDIGDGVKTIPFIIGGDHALMYSDVAALTDVYGKGNVGVAHFDAHYDADKYMMGHLINHGAPIYRRIEEGLVPGKNFIQVGLRGYYPDESSFEWMREQGFRYHTMAEVEQRGFADVMEDVIKEAQDGPEYMFVSFDIDVLDPAFVPATGTPEPGGLTPREAFPILRRFCAESNVVGFELVELSPMLDPTYVSEMNANRLVHDARDEILISEAAIDYLIDQKENLLLRTLTEQERQDVMNLYIEEGILVRQARKIGYENSSRIRGLLIQNMRTFLAKSVPEASDLELRAYFDANPDQLRVPLQNSRLC